MTHQFPVRVYYEDTDLAGIVYYANYLKFIERGRSEWVRAAGVDQNSLKSNGLIFVVRRVEADYLTPARFDDDLVVETTPVKFGGTKVLIDQRVMRDDIVCFEAKVTIVLVNDDGRPARIPAEVRQKMSAD